MPSRFDCLHLVWIVFVIPATVILTIGFGDPDWVVSANGNKGCGGAKFRSSDLSFYFGWTPPTIWLGLTQYFVGIGIFLVWISAIGSLVTLFMTEYQPAIHNLGAWGGGFTLLGLLFWAAGLGVMSYSDDSAPCNICGVATSAFVLNNCTLGDGMIYMIVGLVVGCIAGCVGYSVNHREGAPSSYRARSITGARRRPNGSNGGRLSRGYQAQAETVAMTAGPGAARRKHDPLNALGKSVIIQGLNTVEYNGKRGLVNHYDPRAGRYAVTVGQEVLHVKPENIVVVDKAQSAPVVAYPVSTNAAAFDTCAGQRQGAHRLKGQRGASVM